MACSPGSGALALLVAVLSEDLPRRLTVAGLGAFGLLLGVIVLAPVFSRGLVGAVGAPVTRLGSVGTLAVRNAQRDRRRTAATATAILVGLALVTAIGVLGSSTTKSTDALVDEVVTADFIVQPTSFVPFSTEVGDAIEAVPGIALVSRIRQVPAVVDGAEVDRHRRPARHHRAGPDPGHAGRGAGLRGHRRRHRDRRDGRGRRSATPSRSPGATARRTPSSSRSSTRVRPRSPDGRSPSRRWRPPGSRPSTRSSTRRLEPDADVAAVRADLDTIQADYPTVQILDQTEFKETISGQINQLLSLVYALLGLSVIIAIFGVINTLALSIIERTREIGMLRAVGMLRKQVRTMIRWESIVISFFGAFTGVALGLLLGVALQRLLVNDGITELAIPWTLIVVVLVATAIVGVLAAVWPARRAANLDVLMAIRTE